MVCQFNWLEFSGVGWAVEEYDRKGQNSCKGYGFDIG